MIHTFDTLKQKEGSTTSSNNTAWSKNNLINDVNINDNIDSESDHDIVQLNSNEKKEFVNSNKVLYLYGQTNLFIQQHQTLNYWVSKIYPDWSLLKKHSLTNYLSMLLLIVYLITCFMGLNKEKWYYFQIQSETLVKMGANISYYVARGEIYRLITAGYLHSNLMHIASNLFGIYVVVPRLQSCCKVFHLIIIYLVSVLCGNLLSITSKINTGTFSVGASSGLYGFFGACIGYVIINWNSLFRLGKIRNRLILFLVIYLILAFFPSQASSMQQKIDVSAHIGGLIGGLFMTMIIVPAIYAKRLLITTISFIGLFLFIVINSLIIVFHQNVK